MLESLKGKRIYSVLNNRCPVCHEGAFFVDNHAYKLKTFSKNHDRCLVCNHKFEMETGFFYGAMYASYGLAVAQSIGIFLAVYLLFPATPYYVYIFAIVSSLILLVPFNYRLSRLIWMNLFTKYDAEHKRLVS